MVTEVRATETRRGRITDVEQINTCLEAIRHRMSAAKHIGIVAGRNEPTYFARSEPSYGDKIIEKITPVATRLMGAIRETHGTTESLRPQQEDILYSFKKDGTKITLLDTLPDSNFADTATQELRIVVNTDGLNDVDMKITTDGKFLLKIFFDDVENENGDEESNLVYNSGEIPLLGATEEEGQIMIFFLRHAATLVSRDISLPALQK